MAEVFQSAFNSPEDESSGLGIRPVVFDILATDWETSLLPDGLKMVLHVNPRSMTFTWGKLISRIQTKGGWVEQHWGEGPRNIAFDQATGGFMRLYGGLSNITGPGPTGDGYDAGDEMLAEVAQMLGDVVRANGEKTDFVGRLHGPRFCVITRTRNVESMCRMIVTRSTRLFRKFYSPFEWMKGYVTVESGRYAGDYYLAELNIAGLMVPAKWDNNRAYLLDIAEEVLQKVAESKQAYIIVRP